MGTFSNHDPLFKMISREENTALGPIRIRRKSKVFSKDIKYLQLTKDHTPEEPEEFSRITESGGKVKRYIDFDGNRIGPYRV